MSYSKLIVNLECIKKNINELKKSQYEYTDVIAVVKANAYGLGAKNVARYLEDNKLSEYFAVAYFSEAKELVDFGIKSPIMLLVASTESVIDDLIKYESIYPNVSDFEFAAILNKKCHESGVKKKIHIEINTGMNRLGLKYEDAFETIKKISMLENISIEGIFTHFSSADIDLNYTMMQKGLFDNLLDKLENANIHIPIRHICNSAGTVQINDKRYTAFRPGIMMYGYYPDESFRENFKINPSCKLVTEISHLNNINVGEKVGYNQLHVAEKKTKVATINIGYADGLPRLLTEKGHVMIHSKICKIIGIVCMDTCMIDVTDIDDVKVGEEVVIFDNKNISVDEIAKLCKTINYEILTGIGNRVERIYIEE